MKKSLLLPIGLCILFPASSLFSQESLSGIINQYGEILSVDTCANRLTLANASGFSTGMPVIVIQMKGAAISDADNTSFGNITSLGSAGLFEKNYIAAIDGNEITLEKALVNHYDPAGKVQLVSMPEYDDAVVAGTLTAPAWNGATGGVLALQVNGALTLNADIDVSGKGFRGGVSDITAANNCTFLTAANSYYYNLSDWRGAAKGEGVADFIAGREAGRGAQATGGGGGNDHNSGGGGGAQLTGGGQGGRNEEPGTFGCSGNFPGLGGKTPQDATGRIFLGGGGGAGHENNDVGSDGGHGGGIVILVAQTVEADNRRIAANGLTPDDALGDGAGGGGAGGTLLLDVQNIAGTLQLEAKGGAGGVSDNFNFNRCMGPGGGGGGGRILVDPALSFTADLAGGAAGLTINSAAGDCPVGTNGATAGANGVSGEPFPIPEGEEPNSAPVFANQPEVATACAGQPVAIVATAEGFSLSFQWQIDMGGGFVDLNESAPYSGTQSPELTISQATAAMENYSFRLVVSSDCFPDLLSEPAGITLLQPPMAAFDAAVSGFSVEFQNLSSNADSYSWDFGDGQTSAASNPIYNYAADGEYTVTLVAANECGADTATASVTISNLPVAAFSASPTTGCAPLTVNFDSFDSQNVGSFSWSFPGGVPATSSQADPVVVYNTPGSFGATLIVSNNSGADTLALENLITVADIPTAGFTIASTDLTAMFTNTSSSATSYLWDFGDDATSAQPNPTHTYANPGTYTITLTAVNQCGQVSTSQTITIGEILQAGFGYSLAGGCAPHTVQFFDESTGNVAGWAWTFPGGNPAGAAVPNPVVVYSTPGQYDVTLVVSGAQGGNSLTVQGLVDILPTPEASFTVQLDQLTASFTNLSVNAAFYLWDFGDGNTSTESDPVHTYALPGAYDVTLNAQNAYCGNAVGKTILATTTGTGEYFSGTAVKVFPNPARELIYLEWQDQLAGPLNIRLFTADGRPVWDRTLTRPGGLDISGLPAGMYVLRLQAGEMTEVVKVVKVN